MFACMGAFDDGFKQHGVISAFIALVTTSGLPASEVGPGAKFRGLGLLLSFSLWPVYSDSTSHLQQITVLPSTGGIDFVFGFRVDLLLTKRYSFPSAPMGYQLADINLRLGNFDWRGLGNLSFRTFR